jgi:hypothetical protein
MKYFIQRQLNEYGPYTLADLQRYVAQGSILLTDLTRSEGMSEWMPVSQVIGNIPVPVAAAAMQAPGSTMYGGGNVYGGAGTAPGRGGTVYGGMPAYSGQAVAPVANSNSPAPPDFHWALVLVISIVTCSVFAWVWLFVQAGYIRKIKPNSKGVLFALLSVLAPFLAVLLNMLRGPVDHNQGNPISSMLVLASIVLLFVGLFQMQSDLEDYYNTAEPINLQLDRVMTFFCGIFYFQHHFSRINEWKRTGYLRPQGS